MSNQPLLNTTELKPQLFHTQTNTSIELPPHLSVVNIGKPNDNILPDINVSALTNSEVVSRLHAKIWVQGDTYFIEDVGSANGTFLNGTKLEPKTRYHLNSLDKINLGKGNLVTFIFRHKQDIPVSSFNENVSQGKTQEDEKSQGAFFNKFIGGILRPRATKT